MATQTESAPKMGSIQVFQDLHIKATPSDQPAVRQRLADSVNPPWTYTGKDDRANDPNISVFYHSGDNENCRVRLALLQKDDGFEVLTINPHNPGRISMSRYNDLLQDFAKNVVIPALQGQNASFEVTSCMQNPADWFGDDAACALYRFSCNANKTTGYSHPCDWERWVNFLIKVHENGQHHAATDHLQRWLRESEGWSEEMSHKLTIDYEASGILLDAYDKHLQRSPVPC